MKAIHGSKLAILAQMGQREGHSEGHSEGHWHAILPLLSRENGYPIIVEFVNNWLAIVGNGESLTEMNY